MMRIDIVSIFPEFFAGPVSCGTLRIAQQLGLLKLAVTNPRCYTSDGAVDDYQFGGGAGMVMKPEPIVQAVETLRRPRSRIIHLTPKGVRLDQRLVSQLAREEHLILLCGRYKGFDERVNELLQPLALSVGDYVLAGGEIAALVLAETVTRLMPGVLGNLDSADTDSLASGLLEPPVYTRPRQYRRRRVPSVLTSGDHARVAAWRLREAFRATLAKRPDVLGERTFDRHGLKTLMEVLND